MKSFMHAFLWALILSVQNIYEPMDIFIYLCDDPLWLGKPLTFTFNQSLVWCALTLATPSSYMKEKPPLMCIW